MREFLLNLKHHFGEYLIFAIALFTPIYPAMITIGILLTFDIVAGILAAKKRGEKITSRRLSLTLSKMLLYNMLIISAFLVEKYVVEWVPFVKIVTGFLAIVELKSLAENIGVITGVNVWNAVKSWFRRRKEDVKDVIGDSVEDKTKKDKSDK
jgi:hypothetical protein